VSAIDKVAAYSIPRAGNGKMFPVELAKSRKKSEEKFANPE
jgi:hypothetical protein